MTFIGIERCENLRCVVHKADFDGHQGQVSPCIKRGKRGELSQDVRRMGLATGSTVFLPGGLDVDRLGRKSVKKLLHQGDRKFGMPYVCRMRRTLMVEWKPNSA